MSTSLFPDVNVWVALAHSIHPHHKPAMAWVDGLEHCAPVHFCRFTQLGLLRMLTTRGAMGSEVMTQAQAWRAFDTFFRNPAVRVIEEPPGFEPLFRRYTDREEVSPKLWADAYIAAFALRGRHTLVSFDKALTNRVPQSILLPS